MLSLVVVLLYVVLVNGLHVFWPAYVAEVTRVDGEALLGEITRRATNPDTDEVSFQLKTGNRELDPQRQDFRWVKEKDIRSISYPTGIYVLERVENGNYYGRLERVEGPHVPAAGDRSGDEALSSGVTAVQQKAAEYLGPIARNLAALSHQLQETREAIATLQYRKTRLPGDQHQRLDEQLAEAESRATQLKKQSDYWVALQQKRLAEFRTDVAVFKDASGKSTPIEMLDIVRIYQPNDMGLLAKLGHYVKKIGELLWDNPRESNTEGGLFPAIFGTVMLIFLMAITCFPLGVLAGIYLGEYAKDRHLVRLVRIAVNNLAGIPSIVYGIFGLGFFVYGIGGLIDQWIFPERVAVGSPTFGTGGILWASLTLGLLTVPVVIVSTEEALRAIPRGIREGSLALGATKYQTLLHVLVPMASPGMMTGFILAMARAAGEVAPLMITGVVKLAPQLPLDGDFPYFHLDRKFMHLGFHIYDVGFQSPNVEASKPMVYVTTLLLLLIVLLMTSTAIWLRNRMRKRCQLRTL